LPIGILRIPIAGVLGMVAELLLVVERRFTGDGPVKAMNERLGVRLD
jgi:hypothetical protein